MPDFEEVSLDLIQPNPTQPRTNLSEPQAQAKLASLAQSIEQYGLQQPILIRRMGKPAETGEVYEIVAGERRYLAHKLLGKESIPALTLDEDACANADLISLIENIQRENLDAVDLAHAIQRMIAKADDGPRMTLEDVGKVLGMTKGSVSRVLGVLKLDELDPKYLADYRSGTFQGDDGEMRQVSEVVTGTALSEFSFVARDTKNPLPPEAIDELWGRIRVGALPKNAIRAAAKVKEPAGEGAEPKPTPDATERSFSSLTKALDGLRSVGTLTDEAKVRLRALRDELDAILAA